jgi:hypothetical protein
VKFFHQVIRVHLVSWFPGVVGVGVPFPLQEILEAPFATPFSPGVQHLFNFVFFLTFYYVWGW